MKQNRKKKGVKFPVGAKLVIIISVLLVLSLGAVTALVSFISTEDVRRTAEYNNLTINSRSGSQAEGSFQSLRSAVMLFLNMTDRFSADRDSAMENDFFNFNQSIAAMEVQKGNENIFIPNEKLLISHNISVNSVRNYFYSMNEVTLSSQRISLFNASPYFRCFLTGAAFNRLGKDNQTQTVKVLFIPDDLSETFGVGTNTSFIVNISGDLLLHPEHDLVLGGANFSSIPIIRDMRQQGEGSGRQVSYTDKDGNHFFGAYYQITGTDSAVVTTIPHSVVFEAVRSVTLQNIFLTIAVLFLSILFIWFFSKTISTPVRNLVGAAMQIESGDFDIKIERKTNDEIGLLTESFEKMSGALNVFGRFTNKDIAVRAMKGEIKPGGLPKHATIFFSDIRGFTEKSENFTKAFRKDASDRIVQWLNEYFTSMVDCVEKTGGVVDKFIGDAVMAHWGTAFTAGSPEEDAFNGVKAALMMRYALLKLNKNRRKDDPSNPEICIGCGLNSGFVTAGQIGSEKRMEYTVIGDPVNLASRTEALNKPLGTDILITEDTWHLTGLKFITEEMPPVSVKGKEKPVRMFAVVNLRGAEGPQTLAEVRKLLNITPPDISKVDTNAEEKKYKIKSD